MPGGTVGVTQETAYPNDGRVRLTLSPERPQRFALRLRIPTWTRDRFVPGELYRYLEGEPVEWTVRVNGQPADVKLEAGFAVIRRQWKPGDVVELELPMPVRFNTSDERVEANRGRVAVTRGPLVLCAEEADNGGPVQRLALEEIPAAASMEVGTAEIAGGHEAIQVILPGAGAEHGKMVLIPYYAWNNRGPGSMSVWLPRQPRHDAGNDQ